MKPTNKQHLTIVIKVRTLDLELINQLTIDRLVHLFTSPNMAMDKTLTVVLGSSSIVDEHTHEPILSILSIIVETAIRLRRDGHKVVIVSSGAIAVGLKRMTVAKRPKHLAQVQVCFCRIKPVCLMLTLLRR